MPSIDQTAVAALMTSRGLSRAEACAEIEHLSKNIFPQPGSSGINHAGGGLSAGAAAKGVESVVPTGGRADAECIQANHAMNGGGRGLNTRLPQIFADCTNVQDRPDEGPRRGRPTIIASLGLSSGDLLAIRRRALDLTLGEDRVSHSLAVRLHAQTLAADHPLRRWVDARASKHHLPESLMRAIRIAARMKAHDESPSRERIKHEAYAPGTMRLGLDGQRLLAGQCESWDDASVNFLLWTVLDGQVRVGRFQLLIGVDHATDFITGFCFVARERDSYRAEDAIGRAILPTWRDKGAPERVVLERGVWESHRVNEVLTALQVERSTSYHPRTKLVESVLHRLWTRLAPIRAQVGRSRGADEAGNKLLRQCRAGTLDPREHCLSQAQAADAVQAAAAALNAERIESRIYGRWVPEQRWAAEAPAILRSVPAFNWATYPERRILKVRKEGEVHAQVATGWGFSVNFAFGGADLWKFAGREVAVYFDPAAERVRATLVDPTTRQVLAEDCENLQGDAQAGVELRRAQAQAIRCEHRSLRPGGKVSAWSTESRDSDGASRITTVERPSLPRVREEDSLTIPARDLAPARTPARLSRSDDEIDPELLDRLEREARERGLMTTG